MLQKLSALPKNKNVK